MKTDVFATPRWNEKKGYWQLDIRSRGRRKSFYSKNPSSRKGPAECRRKAQEWLEGVRPDTSIRFSAAWDEFLVDYSKRNKTTSLKQIESRGKAHLLKPFKHTKLEEIQKKDWQAVIDNAFENGAKSLKTLQGIATTIKVFCRWAASHSYIRDVDVPLYFRYPPEATVGKKNILQPEQLRMLLTDDADLWYLPMFKFLVLTGLRRGELCALKTERDFTGDAIFINESISHDQIVTDGKSKQANREIHLGAMALEQIRHHRLDRARKGLHSAYLFCDEDGYRISPRVLRNRWQDWREAHGIDLTMHELRHTFITYSRNKAALDLDDLKRIVGHAKKMDTDATYVHEIQKTIDELEAEEARQRDLAQKIDDTFSAFIDFERNEQ